MKKYAWLCCLLLSGCTWDNLSNQTSAYPTEIADVLRASCATSGCHTTQSAEAAAGLNLETWQGLFLGSRGGSAVIPYSPELSYLLYSVNTDSSRGATLNPTMPLNGTHLSDAQYSLLQQWIADGAPNAKGELRFPDNTTRRKWYVSNQGCDLVAVFDAESRQIMRYVKVGNLPSSSESPHNIKISKDGKFWYVVFFSLNPHIEKYSTLTDEKVGEITIGNGSWNTFTISPAGRFAIAVSYITSGTGTLDAAVVDLENDVVTEPLTVGTKVHGSTAHPTLPRFYLTKQDENGLIVLDYNSQGRVQNLTNIDLLQGVPAHAGDGVLRPHEMIFSPDGSKYFVTCQTAREVRVYNSTTNALLTVINVGDEPVEFALAPATGHLFVTCMEDVTTFAGDPSKHGSVAIIDIQTNALVKSIYTGYQPHGIAVDEVSGYALVANRNVSATGPAPHHSPICGARNGYLTAIDLQSLELVSGFKPELSNDPYAIAVKH
jgi:DNA-binding beta-propeller fold protein YncE